MKFEVLQCLETGEIKPLGEWIRLAQRAKVHRPSDKCVRQWILTCIRKGKPCYGHTLKVVR